MRSWADHLGQYGPFYVGMKAGVTDRLMVVRPSFVTAERCFVHFQPAFLAAAGFRVATREVNNPAALAPDTPSLVPFAVAV